MLTGPVKKVLIIGAGLGGRALLGKLSQNPLISCTAIDNQPTEKQTDTGILLPAYAKPVLRHLGFDAGVSRHGHALTGIQYKLYYDYPLEPPSFLQPGAVESIGISRNALLSVAQGTSRSIQYSTEVSDLIPLSPGGVLVRFKDDKLPQQTFDLVVDAAGFNSPVQNLLMPALPIKDHGFTIWRWIQAHPATHPQATYVLNRSSGFNFYPIGPNQVACHAYHQDLDRRFSDRSTKVKDLLQILFGSFKGDVKLLLEGLSDETHIVVDRIQSVNQPQFGTGSCLQIGNASHGAVTDLEVNSVETLRDVACLANLFEKCAIDDIADEFRAERSPQVAETFKAVSSMGRKTREAVTGSTMKWEGHISEILQSGPPNARILRQLMAEHEKNDLSFKSDERSNNRPSIK